jgi:hypothetical protein
MRKICKDDTWMTQYQQHPTCLIAHCLLAWRNPHLRSANTEFYLEPVALQNTTKHNNATLQPVFKFKTETRRMMMLALPLFGVLALEHGLQ